MLLGIVYILCAFATACFATILIFLIKKTDAKDDTGKVIVILETVGIICLIMQGAEFFRMAIETLFLE